VRGGRIIIMRALRQCAQGGELRWLSRECRGNTSERARQHRNHPPTSAAKQSNTKRQGQGQGQCVDKHVTDTATQGLAEKHGACKPNCGGGDGGYRN